MTDTAAIARALAVNCEAKKHAYRQTQDGVVVSFVLHPQEVPDKLALSALGTRYMLALVEIGDDEKPKGGDASAEHKPVSVDTSPRAEADNAPRGAKKIAQRIGMLCGDPMFQQFLVERYDIEKSKDAAANCVRDICGVESRSEIVEGSTPAKLWGQAYDKYQIWKLAL